MSTQADDMVKIQLPSGADFPVYIEEVDYIQNLVHRYTTELLWKNISDQQDLDRMLILELMVYRWGGWLSTGVDYWGEPVDSDDVQKSVQSYSQELRQVKKLLAIDKTTRDREKGESCHDDQTEVLTERGWRLFKDILPGERVATRSPLGFLEYQEPSDYHRSWFDGDLYVHESNRLNFAVTAQHRMLLFSNRVLSFRPIERFTSEKVNHRLPVTAAVVGREPGWTEFKTPDVSFMYDRPPKYRERWSDGDLAYLRANYASATMPALCGALGRAPRDVQTKACQLELRRDRPQPWASLPASLPSIPRVKFARWLGLFLSEGTKKRRVNGKGGTKGTGVTLTQMKPDGVERIDQIFADLGWPFTRRVIRGRVTWTIYSQELRDFVIELQGEGHELHLPEEVFTTWTYDEMWALLDGLSLGDGVHTTTRGGVDLPSGRYGRYCTSSKTLADDVQRLLAHVGLSGWVRKTYEAGRVMGLVDGREVVSRHDGYQVSYRTSSTATLRVRDLRREPYKGFVYCLSVPNETLLTRRGGVTLWSGNSVAGYLTTLLSRAKEFGVMRSEQAAKAIEGIMQLKALITLMANTTTEEQRENHCTQEDVFEWIVEVLIPEFDAIDEHFRNKPGGQKFWVRTL